MTKIEKLLVSNQAVFTVDDLAILWNMADRKKLWESIKYYLRTKRLEKVYSGVYVLANQDYSQLELAVNVFTPAYISFHTALGIHGINCQQYEAVHLMALASKKLEFNGNKLVYHQLKEDVFFNEFGLKQEEGYKIASAERAICDTLYLVPSMTFDVTTQINADRLLQVAHIYHNDSLLKKVKEIIRKNKDA
jgi:predicted transcriptional regulator of viral defense system